MFGVAFLRNFFLVINTHSRLFVINCFSCKSIPLRELRNLMTLTGNFCAEE